MPTKLYIRKILNIALATLLISNIIVCQSYASDSAEELADYQSKLEKLQKSIKKVQKHLKSTRYKRGHVMTELQTLEAKISNNARKLQKTAKKVKQVKQNIRNLKKDIAKLDQNIKQQQNALADLLRASYALGAQQQLKMLLNQQDPDSIGRVQVYFDYLNQARTKQITAFQENVLTKQKKDAELKSTLAQQKNDLAEYSAQKKQLNQQRRTRSKLLSKLDQDIQNQEVTLSELESSRNRIENLLMSLGKLLADIPPGPGDKQAFGTRKGTLPWPIAGRFLANFGQSKQGKLRWNGVLISSQYGQPVKAISHGRVAFSDWLQGFGFITILDHGNGYMSLYGHNESLFKQAGDWVEAGEVIATVGDSGGHTNPGLYFEIRERGKPVNPKKWCQPG